MKKGFTLIEVILAVLIGAFVAVIALGALKGVSAGSSRLITHIESAGEISYVCDKVKQDLNNLFMAKKAENRKFECELVDLGGMGSSRLVFYTVSSGKARAAEPEGDIYEVEYRLIENEQGETLLVRRLWPNPDKESQPGGMMTVIARNIKAFNVRCHDGTAWVEQWPEENSKLPALIEISVIATVKDSKEIISASIINNFGKNQGDQAVLSSDQDEQGSDDYTNFGGQE